MEPIRPTFHGPLVGDSATLMAIMEYSKSPQERGAGVEFWYTLSVRFHYDSVVLLLRPWRACYDYAALSSRFYGARGFTKGLMLRSHYDNKDPATLSLI